MQVRAREMIGALLPLGSERASTGLMLSDRLYRCRRRSPQTKEWRGEDAVEMRAPAHREGHRTGMVTHNYASADGATYRMVGKFACRSGRAPGSRLATMRLGERLRIIAGFGEMRRRCKKGLSSMAAEVVSESVGGWAKDEGRILCQQQRGMGVGSWCCSQMVRQGDSVLEDWRTEANKEFLSLSRDRDLKGLDSEWLQSLGSASYAGSRNVLLWSCLVRRILVLLNRMCKAGCRAAEAGWMGATGRYGAGFGKRQRRGSLKRRL